MESTPPMIDADFMDDEECDRLRAMTEFELLQEFLILLQTLNMDSNFNRKGNGLITAKIQA